MSTSPVYPAIIRVQSNGCNQYIRIGYTRVSDNMNTVAMLQAANFPQNSSLSRIGYVSSSSIVPSRFSSAKRRMVRKGTVSSITNRRSVKKSCQKFAMIFMPKPNCT